MSFRSVGCQTCKDRRIKCDGAFPICHRCAKSRRPCYGIGPEQAGLIFHVENTFASRQNKRPRGPRPIPKDLTAASRGVMQCPPNNLKAQAVAYYLHYHLNTPEDTLTISKGIEDDLLPLWALRADCPMLDLAMYSMALAVYSRTHRYPPAATEAFMNYHQLLQVMQMAFNSLNAENINTCLLVIVLMARYENIVYRPSPTSPKNGFAKLQSFSHYDGALAVLKFWKDRMSYGEPMTDVIKHTRRCMIRSALLRNLALPDWLLNGADFGEKGFDMEYDCIMVRLVNIRHRLFSLFREPTTSEQSHKDFSLFVEKLDTEAQDLDQALLTWKSHFPSRWCQQRHCLPDAYAFPVNGFFCQTVYSYLSPTYAAVWDQYYATAMLINMTRLRILKLDCSNSEFRYDQHLQCMFNLRSLANDLASSLPFCLQRFRVLERRKSASGRSPIVLNSSKDIKVYVARLAAWPLSIAASLRDLDIEHKTWFKSELARLGAILGDNVLERAETDEWLEL